jgi:aldose 1-epimerase
VPSKQGPGDVADVVLGYDSVASIQSGLRNFGSIVGRYANRIAFGKFQIDDQSYSLPLNNGPNHLHGGPQGFCDKVFTVHSTAVHSDRAEVSLTYTSPDGEQGCMYLIRFIVFFCIQVSF